MEQQLPEIERAKRLINKLMERTGERGCTENEALQASERITQLLEQFDLTLDEVVIRAEKCVTREVYADDDMAGGICRGVARLCSLRYYLDCGKVTPTYILFGFERDMELAMYLVEVLMEAMATEWAEFTKTNGYARKKRDSFRMGFASRISKRLTELRAHRDAEHAARQIMSDSKDLVLVRDGIVDEEFSKTGVELITMKAKKIHSHEAFWSGDAAGQRAQINVPLNGEAQSLLD